MSIYADLRAQRRGYLGETNAWVCLVSLFMTQKMRIPTSKQEGSLAQDGTMFFARTNVVRESALTYSPR